MVHIKEPLLLIEKSSPCGGSGFPLSLSECSFTICLMPYNLSKMCWKEGHVLFNDALNTFYLRLYVIIHMVKDHSDSERGNPLPPHCYPFRLAARVLLYASSHRQYNTYHGLCYTSRGALAGMRNRSMGPPWRMNPMTHRTMSERSSHGATSSSCVRKKMLHLAVANLARLVMFKQRQEANVGSVVDSLEHHDVISTRVQLHDVIEDIRNGSTRQKQVHYLLQTTKQISRYFIPEKNKHIAMSRFSNQN